MRRAHTACACLGLSLALSGLAAAATAQGERGGRAVAGAVGAADREAAGLLAALDRVSTPGAEAPLLTTSERELLRDRLLVEEPLETLRLLRGGIPAGVSLTGRQDRLLLLGSLGDEADVARLVELASGGAEGRLLSHFARSLEALLERVPAALPACVDVVPAEEFELQNAVSGVLAGCTDARALAVLAPLIERDTPATAAALGAIAGLAEDGLLPGWAMIDRVTLKLRSRDAEIRAAACLATGECGAFQAADSLLQLLEDESMAVRRAARIALQSLSGRNYGHDVRRWSSWYALELAWYQQEWPSLQAVLSGGSTPEILRALGGLTAHTAHRREFLPKMLELLDAGAPPVRSHAAAGLGQLGLVNAIPSLVLALADEPAAASAHRSLRTLTGLNLPPEQAEWEQALDLDF